MADSGLPPSARSRLAAATSGSVRGGLLSVGDAVTLEQVGFDQVGEAFGVCVMYIGWTGTAIYGGCGWGQYSMGAISRTVLAGDGRRGGYGPYVSAYYQGWGDALRRMREECSILGGDGVVGVRLARRHLGASTYEFSALGTAVRARSDVRPERPFTTQLDGPRAAALLHSGWVPTGIALGLSVGIRHDDYRTRQQTWWTGRNTEITGYTELLHDVRVDARSRLAQYADSSGADGLVVSDMSIEISELEPSEGHRDHVATAIFVGDGIAHFGAPAAHPPPRPLTVLPLRSFRKESST